MNYTNISVGGLTCQTQLETGLQFINFNLVSPGPFGDDAGRDQCFQGLFADLRSRVSSVFDKRPEALECVLSILDGELRLDLVESNEVNDQGESVDWFCPVQVSSFCFQDKGIELSLCDLDWTPIGSMDWVEDTPL